MKKEEIKELKAWLSTFKAMLTQGFQTYSDEEVESHLQSDLFNLKAYLNLYHEIQVEKQKTIKNPYAQQRKRAYDLNRFSQGYLYLSETKIETVADLQEHIEILRRENKATHKKIKEHTNRIQVLEQCFRYANNIKANEAIHETYQNKTLFKDRYYRENQTTIDTYKRAKALLIKLNGSPKIDTRRWKKEIKRRRKDIESLQEAIKKLTEHFSNLTT